MFFSLSDLGLAGGLQRCVPLALQREFQALPGPWGLRGGCGVCLGAGVSLVVCVPWRLSLNGVCPLAFVTGGVSLGVFHFMVRVPCTIPPCLSLMVQGTRTVPCSLALMVHVPCCLPPGASKQRSVAPRKEEQEEQSSAGTGGRAAPLPLHLPPRSASLLFTKSLHFTPSKSLSPTSPRPGGGVLLGATQPC